MQYYRVYNIVIWGGKKLDSLDYFYNFYSLNDVTEFLIPLVEDKVTVSPWSGSFFWNMDKLYRQTFIGALPIPIVCEVTEKQYEYQWKLRETLLESMPSIPSELIKNIHRYLEPLEQI